MKRRTLLAAAIGAILAPRLPAQPATAITPAAGGYLVPPSMAPLFRGELGRIEHFRFIESPMARPPQLQAAKNAIRFAQLQRIALAPEAQPTPSPPGFVVRDDCLTAYQDAAFTGTGAWVCFIERDEGKALLEELRRPCSPAA